MTGVPRTMRQRRIDRAAAAIGLPIAALCILPALGTGGIALATTTTTTSVGYPGPVDTSGVCYEGTLPDGTCDTGTWTSTDVPRTSSTIAATTTAPVEATTTTAPAGTTTPAGPSIGTPDSGATPHPYNTTSTAPAAATTGTLPATGPSHAGETASMAFYALAAGLALLGLARTGALRRDPS